MDPTAPAQLRAAMPTSDLRPRHDPADLYLLRHPDRPGCRIVTIRDLVLRGAGPHLASVASVQHDLPHACGQGVGRPVPILLRDGSLPLRRIEQQDVAALLAEDQVQPPEIVTRPVRAGAVMAPARPARAKRVRKAVAA